MQQKATKAPMEDAQEQLNQTGVSTMEAHANFWTQVQPVCSPDNAPNLDCPVQTL